MGESSTETFGMELMKPVMHLLTRYNADCWSSFVLLLNYTSSPTAFECKLMTLLMTSVPCAWHAGSIQTVSTSSSTTDISTTGSSTLGNSSIASHTSSSRGGIEDRSNSTALVTGPSTPTSCSTTTSSLASDSSSMQAGIFPVEESSRNSSYSGSGEGEAGQGERGPGQQQAPGDAEAESQASLGIKAAAAAAPATGGAEDSYVIFRFDTTGKPAAVAGASQTPAAADGGDVSSDGVLFSDVVEGGPGACRDWGMRSYDEETCGVETEGGANSRQ